MKGMGDKVLAARAASAIARLGPHASDLASRIPKDLEDYWVHGDGAAKIRWCTEGSFERGRRALREHVPPEMLDGLVANLFHKACGKWPGERHGGD